MRNWEDWLREAGLPEATCKGNAQVSSITDSTTTVRTGSCFVCMPSSRRDTHALIPEAAALGATACVVRNDEGRKIGEAAGLGVVQFGEEDFVRQVGLLSSKIHGDPTKEMRVWAVTGTNGKTTTAWILRGALEELGYTASYLGTLGIAYPGHARALANTTPFPCELWNLISEAEQAGCTDFIMEASSHALAQGRLAGVRFDVGAFTNLSQDHLDFHGDMESYAEAKKMLFTRYAIESEKDFVGTMNASEPVTDEWLRDVKCKVVTYGMQAGDLRGEARSIQVDHIAMTLTYCGESQEIETGLGGEFNVINVLTVASMLVAKGFSLRQIARALTKSKPVPGRFEAIENSLGIGVLVDYAHTPDALEKLLSSARKVSSGRLIAVFGCGGDRDRTKRPLMAKACEAASDLCVVTSDNPRTEDPLAIIDDIKAGFSTGYHYTVEPDRAKAVMIAIGTAQKGDLVVIAGKGHEDYQILGTNKVHMDDRELAREALMARAVTT